MLHIQSLRHPVIQAQDLRLETGQGAHLHGPSGAGKSVLLRCLADLLPWQGELTLSGRSVWQTPPAQWRRTVIYNDPESAWWAPTVADHFLHQQTAPLDRLGLAPALLQRSPASLSSGQRQRLALLRALDRQPRVLCADEPCANLDTHSADAVEKLLADYLQQGGILLYTSHRPTNGHLPLADWHIVDGEVRDV